MRVSVQVERGVAKNGSHATWAYLSLHFLLLPKQDNRIALCVMSGGVKHGKQHQGSGEQGVGQCYGLPDHWIERGLHIGSVTGGEVASAGQRTHGVCANAGLLSKKLGRTDVARVVRVWPLRSPRNKKFEGCLAYSVVLLVSLWGQKNSLDMQCKMWEAPRPSWCPNLSCDSSSLTNVLHFSSS